MRQTLILFLGAALVAGVISPFASADDKADERVTAIENRIGQLETRINHLEASLEHHSSSGAVLFLYGAVCALWAQNSGRSAWLWFFLGLFFSVITVIVLLVKNSDDRKRHRRQRAGEQLAGTGSSTQGTSSEPLRS